ncbi:MAG TPA: hypothetical protein VGI56_13595 [Galbitalea sp.]
MSDEHPTFAAVPSVTDPPAAKDPISLDRAVEEGLLIARAALTMEVKNYIIVTAIRDGQPYDLDDVSEVVRRELHELATENDENAARVDKLAAQVLKSGWAKHDSEGYQAGDHPALTNRVVIHSQLSEQLNALADDADYVAGVAERARMQAWTEVGDAIESRLLDSLPKPPDRYYEEDKEARLRAFANINLRALEKQAARKNRLSNSG